MVSDVDVIAIEVKIGSIVRQSELKGLVEFTMKESPSKSFVVCQLPRRRLITLADDKVITLLPWEEFLQMLWRGEVF